MLRPKSHIPRLKLASSYGDLTRFSSNTNLASRPVHDRQKSPITTDGALERKSMIDAPVPVTHRRMCGQYQLTRPPWATDDSLNPFDRDTDFGRPKRAKSHYNIPSVIPPDPTMYRDDSPPLSIDNSEPFFDNESMYRAEVHSYIYPRPTLTSEGVQTDVSGTGFVPQRHKTKPGTKSTVSNQEKRSTVHPKELKRHNQNNNSTYRIKDKITSKSDTIPTRPSETDSRNEEDMQARIDYWLKKNIDSFNGNIANGDSHHSTNNSKRPQFRNQITFTPRNVKVHEPNGFSPQTPPNPASPQTIEAVIVYSDSGSEKDNIVSSRSLESRSHRPRSHLSPRSKSPVKNDIPDYNAISSCDVCGKEIHSEYRINSSGISCHRECFICSWCKKRLSLENYKINSNKLCCPLHFRLAGT